MAKGWVKLHRKIEDNDLWFEEKFTGGQAWIDLMLGANHKEKTINVRGNIVTIGRGQLGWSEVTMATRWKWSRNKVRRFLKRLETEQQIKQQKYRYITTIITILNYDKYQSDTAEKQQKDNRRNITKNVKNDKNVKKGEGRALTPVEINRYFFEEKEPYHKIRQELLQRGVPEKPLDRELSKFMAYWTEKNKSGTRDRWELQATFDVKRRLLFWLSKVSGFEKSSVTKRGGIIT